MVDKWKYTRGPDYYQKSARKHISYWWKLVIGSGGALGLCKLGESVTRILTDDRMQSEVLSNAWYLSQYRRELLNDIVTKELPATQIPDVIPSALGVLCIALPIALGLGTVARKAAKRKD